MLKQKPMPLGQKTTCFDVHLHIFFVFFLRLFIYSNIFFVLFFSAYQQEIFVVWLLSSTVTFDAENSFFVFLRIKLWEQYNSRLFLLRYIRRFEFFLQMENLCWFYDSVFCAPLFSIVWPAWGNSLKWIHSSD